MLIYFFARFQIEVYDESHKTGASNGCGDESAAAAAAAAEAALPLRLQMTSQGKTWILRRSYEHFRLLDQQLHRCIYDRKFSQLPDLPPAAPPSTDPDAPPTDEVLFFFACFLFFVCYCCCCCCCYFSPVFISNRRVPLSLVSIRHPDKLGKNR